MNRIVSLGLVALAGLATPLWAQAAPSCAEAREIVLPGLEELAAETIPWRTTFKEGALAADQLDRPVLLWAMNGHPLGCT